MEDKWVHANVDLNSIGLNYKKIIRIVNSGDLQMDFYNYARFFYEAAETIIEYLLVEASKNHDIAKLDLWYFAMIYLYRQSLELLIKASIFQNVTDTTKRKEVIGDIRHDLKQAFELLIKEKGLQVNGNKNAEWVSDYLSDISQIDRESDMFRYPFGRNFKALFQDQTDISLVATQNNMGNAYSVVENIYKDSSFPTHIYTAFPPKLIIQGGSYYQRSVVGYKYAQNSFYPYFSSYSEVGSFLRDKVVMENKDDLFLPMCYLYRNAVELGLKRIIFEDSHVSEAKAMKIMSTKKHSILGLWNSIKVEIEKTANAPQKDPTLGDVQQYIKMFHDFDQSSDRFRYPCNKNMDSYFLDARRFDVENVANCFEELLTFLDSVDSMFCAMRDYEIEMMSEYSCD